MIRHTKVTTMPENTLPRTVDLIQDWGLGADLGYFKELVGSPRTREKASLAELAAIWATWVKERLLVRDSQVTLLGGRVEYHWHGCRFVSTARSLAQEGAQCRPCPLAEMALDLFARRGWTGELIHHGWEADDICTVAITAHHTLEANHETTGK